MPGLMSVPEFVVAVVCGSALALLLVLWAVGFFT